MSGSVTRLASKCHALRKCRLRHVHVHTCTSARLIATRAALENPIKIRELSPAAETGRRAQQLSDLDQLLFEMMTPMYLIYKAQDASTVEGRKEIAMRLRRGLVQTLEAFPQFTGFMSREPLKNRAFVEYPAHGDCETVPFSVSGVETPAEELPTMMELDSMSYPSSVLSKPLLAPTGQVYHVFGASKNSQAKPLLATKVTFIRGNGVLVSIAINHTFSDVFPFHEIVAYWSANCRALNSGQPLPKAPQLNHERSILTGGKNSRWTANSTWETLRNLRLGIENITKEAPHAGQHPKVVSRTYAMSNRKLAGAVTEVSTSQCFYSKTDFISALLWRAVTRARLRVERTPSSTTQFYTTTALRSIFPDIIPKNYCGNAFLVIGTEAFDPNLLLDEMTIKQAAQAVRRSIRGVSTTTLSGLVSFAHEMPSYGTAFLSPMSHMTMNMNMTKWGGISMYSLADFGFGTPTVLRHPDNGIESAILYPPRPGQEEGDFLELFLSLEESCQQLVLQDDEFRAYFPKAF